jgi:hypothetical protein
MGTAQHPVGETRDQGLCRLVLSEASTGFEPVIRVLQTLAFPLGHDAISSRHSRLMIYDLRIAD